MSAYLGFDVAVDNDDLTETLVPSLTVKVRDVTAGVDLADVTADANGHVAAGTYGAVAVGHVLRFRVENYQGMAGFLEQTTT